MHYDHTTCMYLDYITCMCYDMQVLRPATSYLPKFKSSTILALLDQLLRGSRPPNPLVFQGSADPEPRALIFLSMSPKTRLMRLVQILETQNSRLWKGLLLSRLKTLEGYIIFGAENLGRVYHFQSWTPSKCTVLFSELKPQRLESLYYFRVWKLSAMEVVIKHACTRTWS